MILNKHITKTTAKIFGLILAIVMVVGALFLANSTGEFQFALMKVSANNTADGDTPISEDFLESETEPENYNPNLVGFVYSPDIPMSQELQEFTYMRCVEENLDYTVVLALIWRESRFNPSAKGYNSNGTVDSGIMQINDVNLNWLRSDHNITDLFNPEENIKAGTIMLGDLTEKYGLHYALMAYKSGEQGMLNSVSAGKTTSKQTELLYTKSNEFKELIYNEEVNL